VFIALFPGDRLAMFNWHNTSFWVKKFLSGAISAKIYSAKQGFSPYLIDPFPVAGN
jgi:hypothetical protein